jgi:hypothetical protein
MAEISRPARNLRAGDVARQALIVFAPCPPVIDGSNAQAVFFNSHPDAHRV